MKGRYEIRDRQNPTARGMRFTRLEHAERGVLTHAVPLERWFIFDRQDRVAVGGGR